MFGANTVIIGEIQSYLRISTVVLGGDKVLFGAKTVKFLANLFIFD